MNPRDGQGADLAPERMEQIWTALEAGDRSVLPELRSLLEEHPSLVHHFGDVGALALQSWRDLFQTEDDDLRNAGIEAKLARMAGELDEDVGDLPSRLLRDRVLVTWLQLSYLDLRLAASVKAGDCLQPHLSKLHKSASAQHLAVLKAWTAHVRRGTPRRASPMVQPQASPTKGVGARNQPARGRSLVRNYKDLDPEHDE